ncbi:nitronate monooxygenase [Actinoplanes sp. GCM10030250]|uniref:nitronate monooxygenase n=1 Tax=Actinoplanes sp. GCM10030250 TaxID=3273376 RepID=UPI003622DDBE
MDAAKQAVDDGVDVVVAQGLEAGGHNYATLPTFALVPLVVDAVAPALVLAAGGIADGRGLAAALMLGADGDRADQPRWPGDRHPPVLQPRTDARHHRRPGPDAAAGAGRSWAGGS